MTKTLVQLPVDVIVTDGNAAALAAKRATQGIPIVMTSRQSGEGRHRREPRAIGCQHPQAPRCSIPSSVPSASRSSHRAETEAAARSIGLQVHAFKAGRPSEVDGALRAAVAERTHALITVGDGMLWTQRARIVDFAIRHRLPAMFPDREFAEAGGLMVYGPNAADSVLRAAALLDRVLKAPSRPTYRSSSPHRWTCCSTARPPGCSGLPCRNRCACGRTSRSVRRLQRLVDAVVDVEA
jgi:putative tryptophan/tyrosine transport system substrate-binding protein